MICFLAFELTKMKKSDPGRYFERGTSRKRVPNRPKRPRDNIIYQGTVKAQDKTTFSLRPFDSSRWLSRWGKMSVEDQTRSEGNVLRLVEWKKSLETFHLLVKHRLTQHCRRKEDWEEEKEEEEEEEEET